MDATSYREPDSPIEKEIVSILEGLLRMEKVGLDDDFLQMTRDSLLGTRLVLRVRERFGVTLTLRDLFTLPTAGQLAEEIEWRLIARLDAMSDEEAGRLLAQME